MTALGLFDGVLDYYLDDIKFARAAGRARELYAASARAIAELLRHAVGASWCGVFIIGVTMVKGYETERDVRMDVGDTLKAGGYEFRFNGATEVEGPNYVAARGRVTVSKDGKLVTEMYPEKRQYNASGMPMTEAAISAGLLRDLYVSLGEPIPDSNGAWAVRVYIKPFVDWIWAGCLLMGLGGVLAISDRRYRIHRRASTSAAAKSQGGGALLAAAGKQS